MQAIIFTGFPASGKSSFYREHFFYTHVRISMDLLNTRNKEQRFIDTCLDLQQRVVIDNTNPRAVDRLRYVSQFKAHGYELVSYYFEADFNEAVARNAARAAASGKREVTAVAMRSISKQLEVPRLDEGFDECYCVQLTSSGFAVRRITS